MSDQNKNVDLPTRLKNRIDTHIEHLQAVKESIDQGTKNPYRELDQVSMEVSETARQAWSALRR